MLGTWVYKCFETRLKRKGPTRLKRPDSQVDTRGQITDSTSTPRRSLHDQKFQEGIQKVEAKSKKLGFIRRGYVRKTGDARAYGIKKEEAG